MIVTARRARLRIVRAHVPLRLRRVPRLVPLSVLEPVEARSFPDRRGDRPVPPDRNNTEYTMGDGSFCGAPRPAGVGSRGPLGWAPSTLEPIGADLSALFPLSKTLLSGTARRGTSSPGLDSRPRLCTGTVGRLALGRTRALLSHLKTETVARLCTSGTVGRLGRARALLSHPSNRVVGVAARVARVVPQLAAALAERGAVANEVARQVHVRCRWCVRVRRPPRPQCLLHGGTADAVADKGLGR